MVLRVSVAWLRFGLYAITVTDTCELGTRERMLPVNDVIMMGVKRHRERMMQHG